MDRRTVLKLFGGLAGLFLCPLPAEAKAKPLPKDVSGTYRGHFGKHCTLVVRATQKGNSVSYTYRFRNKKKNRKFAGTGKTNLTGPTMRKNGVSVVLDGRKLRLYLPGGRQAVLKR